MSNPASNLTPVSRRQFLREGARAAAVTGLGGLLGVIAGRAAGAGTVWQIDPQKCLRCDHCATHCVLEQSAVKCVHAYAICGYCQLCTGFFEPAPNDLNTGAENCLCPTAAIKRSFVEDPYYEYTIDEKLCIGCAKCVEGATASATARSSCRSATIAVSIATNAPSRGSARAMPSAACRRRSRTCSRP